MAPAVTGFAGLRRAEDGMLAALPEGFDILTLAPVLPLGAHSAVAAVDPRNVIATIRGTEVPPTRRTAWPWRRPCGGAPLAPGRRARIR